ncbi:LemA family protein [Glaciecola sp. XM2]|jgi:LemA protein|uniref:LemA family protein n=1 Tax=Glaciecola sp. XM2 TaxID=1914931 RepID=UPI001BDF252A|nr:LemA family protein [Glaciecola sp. XM2]MBT1450585.1 LemA family protein [Glaciecola sp. XM2]
MDISSIIIIAIVVLAAVFVVGIYNGIISRKNAVERAWAGVITQERQKNKILPDLEQVVKEHKEFESSILENITKLRSKMNDLDDKQIDTQSLGEIESLMQAVKGGINVTVEAYPDLKTAGLMSNLMREMTEQQENIGAAIRIFNQNVEAFNEGIEIFPNSLVNQMLNKQQRIDVFSDKQASEGFDYKPNF